MNPRALIWILSLAAMMLSGCAGYQQYRPLSVRLDASRDVRAAAVRELATSERWQLVAQRARGARIEAIADETETRRDHIFIDTSRDETRIAVRTELRSYDGEWMSSNIVCPNYSYARENQVATQIERIARSRQPAE